MDLNSDEYLLKELLVNLEEEHKHLQASVAHLSNNVTKREVEIRQLVTARERRIAEEADRRTNRATGKQADSRLIKSQSVDFDRISRQQPAGDQKFSSEFSRQVSEIVDRIIETSEEVNSLVRL